MKKRDVGGNERAQTCVFRNNRNREFIFHARSVSTRVGRRSVIRPHSSPGLYFSLAHANGFNSTSRDHRHGKLQCLIARQC